MLASTYGVCGMGIGMGDGSLEIMYVHGRP